jgi:excisionase family DNA binding protein
MIAPEGGTAMPQRRSKQSLPPTRDDVYTMAEAARLKGVSYHTVSRAVRRGTLPARRLGRMAFIAADDLRDLRPMVERAPKKYRRRQPDAAAVPSLVDLASGERVDLANRLALLVEANHELTAGLPVAAFLAHMAERVREALALQRVEVWQWDHNPGAARRRARAGTNAEPAAADQPAIAARDVARWRGLDAAIVVDAPAGDTDAMLLDARTPLAAVPLRLANSSLGVVLGDRGGARFNVSSADLQLAQALANQAAIAIELERLQKAAEAITASGA